MGQKKDLVIFFRAKKKKSWKKFLPRFFEKPGQKKKILKKENLKKKKKLFVLWFEHRISRVLGERHDQARPYEHGGGLREPSTRIELVTLRLLSACSANWAMKARQGTSSEVVIARVVVCGGRGERQPQIPPSSVGRAQDS